MKLLLTFLLTTLIAAAADFTVQRDLPYAAELKLDLYQPTASQAPTPLIVWVHGGAWSGGSKKDMPLTDLIRHGISIASVDYRLSGTAPFPANVHDLKAAIRFLRAGAGSRNIDPARIIIAGASAGGHLAALVGLSQGNSELEGSVGTALDRSSAVQGIISFYGASDLSTLLSQSSSEAKKMRLPALTALLGGPPAEKSKLATLASPISHLDPRDPPLLLFHGDRDPQMPYQQSLDLHAACLVRGIFCQFITLHGASHGGSSFYKTDQLSKIRDFIHAIKSAQP